MAKDKEAVVAAPGPNVTVGDADVLDCGLCGLPLSPPIFQCKMGHVVCSDCHDKLVDATCTAAGNGNKCHVCGVAGYRRSHAMERLVDSVRVACPYAAHGCDATPPYHGRESHRRVCRHAPWRCPGGEPPCGFIGSDDIAALLDHFAGAHSWPCDTEAKKAGVAFLASLQDGFNFFLVVDDDHDDDDDDGDEAAAARRLPVPCLLFLLNVSQERLGLAISVLGIHPHAHADGAVDGQPLSTRCELVFSRIGDGSLFGFHEQSSEFQVACTDLSNGLPSPDACFQFIVPNCLVGDNKCIQVAACFRFEPFCHVSL